MAKNKTQWGTVKKLLRYIRRHTWLILASLLFAGVSAVLTLYVPILTGRAIDCIVAEGRVDFQGIFQVIKIMLLVVLVTALAQWLMNVCNNRITYQIVRDMRMDAFSKIEILPLKYLDAHSYGELVSRVIADADQVAEGLLMGFTQFFTGIITILGTLCFMISIQYKIALVVICITPLSLFVASFIAKRTYVMFKRQSETRGEQTALVEEMIANQKVVQAYGQEQRVLKRFDEINEKLRDYSLEATFFSSMTNPSTRFVNSLVYTGVGIFGAVSAVMGQISVGQLASFLGYANQYTKPFNEISGVVTELQNAIACAGRILELIEEEPQTPEGEDSVSLSHVQGNVDLKHVDFSYVKGQNLIVDFNLKVSPGQRIAIVGPTGCGKTTLINLLMRFYDVDSGAILVDGEDIRHVTRESLRTSYGMVLQETWLREGTILDNIRMGSDATREEVVEASKASHAHSFIKRLPKGYDTWITEDGGGLSQGQKQLLCIARVMLSLPSMLILDEATSSIDTRTEIKIQKAKNGSYATLYNSQFVASKEAE